MPTSTAKRIVAPVTVSRAASSAGTRAVAAKAGRDASAVASESGRDSAKARGVSNGAPIVDASPEVRRAASSLRIRSVDGSAQARTVCSELARKKARTAPSARNGSALAAKAATARPAATRRGAALRKTSNRAVTSASREEGSVPLHLQVFNKLRSDIFRGVVKEGARLPGEIALGKQFNVSRITIRRALEELAARGLIERVQGRGTTVSRRPSFSPVVADVNGLLERNVLIGFETTSRLAEFSYVPAPAEIAEVLGLAKGAMVQMAVRIRTRDNMPFAFVTSWIPASIGRRFDAAELETTPVLALLEQHGVVIDYIEQTISSQTASRAVGRALGVEPGAPLLKVERIVFAIDGKPVENSEALYPAERHQYRITLRRGERASKANAKARDKAKFA